MEKFLGNPLVSEIVREIAPFRVLESEACLPRADDKVKEPDSPCAKPLTSNADTDNEPASVLKRAEFFVMIAEEPSELVSVLLRLLDWDAVIETEPDRALKIEACFVRGDEVPIAAVRSSTCPFDTEAPRPSEPVSSFPIPFVSALPSEREPARFLASPLVWETVMDIEPVSALNSEECSTNVETGDNEPTTVLNSDR